MLRWIWKFLTGPIRGMKSVDYEMRHLKYFLMAGVGLSCVLAIAGVVAWIADSNAAYGLGLMGSGCGLYLTMCVSRWLASIFERWLEKQVKK